MLIDAFQRENVTRLAKDSIFMMPHLGVLSQVHPQAASEVFDKDCMIYLGTCIAPVGTAKAGKPCLSYSVTLPGDEDIRVSLSVGEMKMHRLQVGATARIHLDPSRDFDVGKGRGVPMDATVQGGTAGLIIDCRGRPLTLPQDPAVRISMLKTWIEELGIYPSGALQ
jgi:hypothetical protein